MSEVLRNGKPNTNTVLATVIAGLLLAAAIGTHKMAIELSSMSSSLRSLVGRVDRIQQDLKDIETRVRKLEQKNALYYKQN